MKKMITLLTVVLLLHNLIGDNPLEEQPNNYSTLEEYYNDSKDLENIGQQKTQEIKNSYFGDISQCNPLNSLVKTLITNSTILLMIMVLVTALLYMVGNFFELPNIKAMAYTELWEIIISALLIVGLSAVLTVPSMLGFDIYEKATEYAYKMLDKISIIISRLTTVNIIINSVYTIFIPLGPVRRAISIQLGPVLRPIIDGVSFSLQFLITSYGEWIVFTFMFCFIKEWFLTFFFPFGILLRSIPQTRGGGNTIIALAFALSTIYPLTFYIDSLIFDAEFQHAGLGAELKNAIIEMFGMFGLMGLLGLTFALSTLYISPFFTWAIIGISYLMMNTMIEAAKLVLIFSILMPIINIFITLTFTREIARHLGTEINVSALIKLL